jgi:hypothetical protein
VPIPCDRTVALYSLFVCQLLMRARWSALLATTVAATTVAIFLWLVLAVGSEGPLDRLAELGDPSRILAPAAEQIQLNKTMLPMRARGASRRQRPTPLLKRSSRVG